MKRGIFFFIVVAVLCISAYSQSSEGLTLAPGLNNDDLKKLIDNPAVLTANVKELPKDSNGKNWFSLFCDTHIVSLVSIDTIYAVLNDYADYPKNFSGSKKVEVIRKTNEGNVIKATAGKLGVTSTYVYLQKEPINTSSEHYIIKTEINGEGDGTMKNMLTEYYLKTVVLDGKSYTYIRLRDFTDYMARMPGQLTVMKNSNESSHKEGLVNIIKAAAKR
ncbi:MAG: hypothetical protein LBD07_01200 [Spirochaetaceae bacterium]|jgi:hypothetical protein|nr:hypothetical protein [Spirochaetaceae bacterium]